MSTWTDSIFESAEFIGEWNGPGGLRYKLYFVTREAVDDDSDEPPAHLLHGIDSGNVRRVDILIDTAYDRELNRFEADRIAEARLEAPAEMAEILDEILDASGFGGAV